MKEGSRAQVWDQGPGISPRGLSQGDRQSVETDG